MRNCGTIVVMDYNAVKQAIKDSVDIVDLVSQYTSLVPAGKRMKGLSPFTNEKTPSFFVDSDNGFYYCFSSQKGGDIFSFVEEMEGVDFKGALAFLADRAGIQIDATHSQENVKSPLYHILESATEAYRNNLTDAVKKYLMSRGITEESIQVWGIGYAPDAWHTLCDSKTPRLTDYVDSGLCIQKDKNVYDRFRSRIMFPFYDAQKRVIAFSGREYGTKTGAKYINSPESPLFSKSVFLYGLHIAKQHIRKSNFSILTEGPIDTVMVHQAGFPVAVAASGTAVTIEHILQLQRLSNRLIIAFDSDAAGMRATIRVIGMALSLGMDIKTVILPEGSDPADTIAHDVSVFRKALKEASPVVQFMIQYIAETHGDSNEDLLRGVREDLIPLIACITDPLMREYAVSETAKACSLSKESIAESVQNVGHIRQQPEQPRRIARKQPAITQKNTDQKIASFLETVAHARAFLVVHDAAIPDTMSNLLEKIESYEHLPDVDEQIATIRYEEKFPDTSTRIDMVREELSDMLIRVHSEVRKREAVRKIQENI